MKRFVIIIFGFLVLAFSSVFASERIDILDTGSNASVDAPGGDWTGIHHPEGKVPLPEQEWLLRTGFKKKVFGATLDDEISSAPDIAVLRSGSFGDWPLLLSRFREPWTFVEPGDVASIGNMSPLLIIPSGGLYGLSGSEFFRAGLEAYLNSGGIILCLSQQRGDDFSGLPVPDGSHAVAGAGWREDAGPMFRASFVQSTHPSLSGIKKSLPDIETDGYLEAYPADSQILLSRPDGRPTALQYRIGRGLVIVTTLFSEVSYARGVLPEDERIFVRDLLAWAKAQAMITAASPGRQLDLNARIVGHPNIETRSVKISVIGPDREGRQYEQTKKLSIPAGEEVQVPLSFILPADAKHGVYHIEYALMDGAGREASPMVESATGWFSIGSAPTAPLIKRAPMPLDPFSRRIKTSVRTEQTGDNARIILSLSSEAASRGSSHFFARIAGQEKFFNLSGGKTDVVLDLPVKKAAASPVIGVYHSSGRLVSRTTSQLVKQFGRGIFPERPFYSPGETARLIVSGLGEGELTLIGLGKVETQMAVEARPVEFMLPSDIPSAVYPVKWEFRHMDESMEEGEFLLRVEGPRVYFAGSELTIARDGGRYSAKGELRLGSAVRHPLELRMFLKEPDGMVSMLDTKAISATPEKNSIPVSFFIKPKSAGIHELIYGLFMHLPEGAGMGRNSVAVAIGRKAFDIGEATVLGIGIDRPVRYHQSGSIALSAFVYGRSEAKIVIQNEDRRLYRDSVSLNGLSVINLSIESPLPGEQSVTASARAGGLESKCRKTFTYGTDLPDLAIAIDALDIKDASLPIAVLVKNIGSKPAARTKAEVFEGEGLEKLIGAVDVPLLKPGEEHFAVVPWRITGKTGRVLVSAVVDRKNRIAEPGKRNNTVSAHKEIPEVMLVVSPAKEAVGSGEPVVLTLSVLNIGGTKQKAMSLVLQVMDPRGVVEKAEQVPMPDLEPEKEAKIEHIVSLEAARPGRYRFNAVLSRGSVIATGTADVTIQPTLLLTGDLDGTQNSASPCSSFSIQYNVKSAGNVEPTTVGLDAEIRPHGSDRPAARFGLTYGRGRRSLTIERLMLPSGRYTLSLKAVAANKEHNISREFVLAEHPLIVSAPVEIVESSGATPRVLVWSGRHEAPVRSALSETILRHAYDGRGIYYRVVDNVEDFENQAMTGIFNVYILLEQDAMLTGSQWLKENVERGNGLVIIGDGDRSIATMAEFGFRPGSVMTDETRVISFAKEVGATLSGTAPVSGPIVRMEKKGARAVAVVGEKGTPAIVTDSLGKGRVTVMPFSIIRSALDTGALPLYGLMLGSLTDFVAPEHDDPHGPVTGGFVISSPSGPVKTKVVDTLPKPSRIIWSDGQGTIKDDTITYEITADPTHRRVTYIYETEDRSRKVSRRVLYECNGKFVDMERGD